MASINTGVPAHITAELTQILSNLVLGDNEIRASAEEAVNERLSSMPEVYLLGLAQFALAADTPVMRSFSFVLLRRLLFRKEAAALINRIGPRLTLYDRLSSNSLTTLERVLLYSLSHEPSALVRHKAVDTIADVANEGMTRGRMWHALQAQALAMAQGELQGMLGPSAFLVFAASPALIADLQMDAILGIFARGLADDESADVRHAALSAAIAYLCHCESAQFSRCTAPPESNTSGPRSTIYLTRFLTTLLPLATSHPTLFAPHLSSLLTFLPGLIQPSVDSGPTPTVTQPFPASASASGSFGLPEDIDILRQAHRDDDVEDDIATLRHTALEFMVSLTEAKPSMVSRVDGWTAVLVRACLEGMGEWDIPNDPTGALTAEWLAEDPSSATSSSEEDNLYEQSLDRLACALGGKAVLPVAFTYIPSMLCSYDWRARHAGLMAIAAIGEGTGRVMVNELGKVVSLVTPTFRDQHPRVRYAACQCIGQLCTDLEEVIQDQFHREIFSVLIPTLDDPEPRVHSHAAAALINFCEGVERDTLAPYLDPIVERLLKLLNQSDTNSKRYVQEQVITTLAMVADASETTFAKHYPTIMPILLNILQHGDRPEYKKLRIKAMECAGLVAIAVGRDMFRADSQVLAEHLIRIQKSPVDPSDTLLGHSLMATWAKLCQAMGPGFEPYLPVVMPNLLAAAAAKADFSLYDDESEEKEGYETLEVGGQLLGVRTSSLEEKCQAFDTLVIYCSTLGPQFAPYLMQTLEVVLPCLTFHIHEGVREACAIIIPMLLSCGKRSGTLTPQIINVVFVNVLNCMDAERDATYLASLFKCIAESVAVLDGPSALPTEYHDRIMQSTKRQLQALADRRRARSVHAAAVLKDQEQRVELAFLEEMEGYALDEMSSLLKLFDANHPLLVAVGSVRDLGVINEEEWNENS
ncbi:ARM repeat-containing protein [Fistulina hepatica ATCC 64428]|uniref:ARM repeat-containing protein n=1 Tax=Fistulina hepatica ATCC 64428 TaxID=1128425 RepID=A0A0D7A079_9AGAR|nr:ARM repeat-containing protein [Fistulina hepatica ATCC 64428]